MRTNIIRPGLLVALKSSLTGGVHYKRTDLAAPEASEGAQVSRWETERVIDDPTELDRASKARAKALYEIRSVCAITSFGLLCPEAKEAELDAAIARARAMVETYNQDTQHSRVSIFALKGRIASTDEQAARAIASDVSELLSAMNRGIDRLDPAAIREAANKAKGMVQMLDEATQAKVSEAILEARQAAKAIVARVEKAGEQAADVLASLARTGLEKARFALLDMSDDVPDAMPAAPAPRAVECTPDASEAVDADSAARVASPAGRFLDMLN